MEDHDDGRDIAQVGREIERAREQFQRARRGSIVAGPGASALTAQLGQALTPRLVTQALRANREMQGILQQQLVKLSAAKRANDAAARDLARDWKRCKHADVQMRRRGEQERRQQERKHRDQHRQERYRKASSYFTAGDGSSPDTNSDAAMPGLPQFRRMVPLVYSNTAWSKVETEKLTKAVRVYCQQQRQIMLLDTGGASDAAAEFPENYAHEENELRSMPLHTLLDKVEAPIDWEVIAWRVKFRHGAQECAIHWAAVADPRLRHGEWAEEERASLCRLAASYGEHHWQRVASSLGGHPTKLPSPRTAIACFQQYQQHEQPGLVRQRAGWEDKQEDARLIDLYEELGPQWRTIALRLGGRTPAQCLHRYKHALKPGIKRGKWSRDEDIRLETAVGAYASGGGEGELRVPWFLVARHVPDRTEPQCRERWMNVLRLEVKAAGEWSRAEVQRLEDLVNEQLAARRGSAAATAVSWAAIATALRPRTDRQCARRWKRLVAQDRAVAGS